MIIVKFYTASADVMLTIIQTMDSVFDPCVKIKCFHILFIGSQPINNRPKKKTCKIKLNQYFLPFLAIFKIPLGSIESKITLRGCTFLLELNILMMVSTHQYYSFHRSPGDGKIRAKDGRNSIFPEATYPSKRQAK